MNTYAASTRMGARFVREAGYDGCVELSNDSTRVVLDPNVGGRVVRFASEGREALHVEPAQDGLLWDGTAVSWHPAGGRFDIGPEFGAPSHREIWLGRWNAEITGPRSARLTSPTLPGAGLRLVRDFELGATAHLCCSQAIHNNGSAPLAAFHWSRTFLPGTGIALAPVPPGGRFPNGYAVGGPAGVINFLPQREPNLRVRDGVLEVLGLPDRPKIVLDVHPGWLAYAQPSGLVFLKTFPVDPTWHYGEPTANNASIWYGGRENTPGWPLQAVAEIEAIGPHHLIAPGGSCAFTEHWFLFNAPPFAGQSVDLGWLRAVAAAALRDSVPGRVSHHLSS